MQHTVRQAQAGQICPTELAIVAYGAAHCGRGGLLNLLFAALARAVKRRLGVFSPQDLANTAWSIAKVGHLDAQLFLALAREAEPRVDDFDMQGLGNTAWAFENMRSVTTCLKY